ncbi:SRPBCC family protein [Halomicrobium katesii]|uniref:SRPBCC family protein n=1 Tax=Halomicrobium katesii TaxID=437163 RepID=UPI00036CD726|nr:SRPBCC family protein [Halomicrobium katesii]
MALNAERTPDGRRLCVSRAIPATRDAAWRVLTDTNQWPDWGPSVRAVESSERIVERGTAGRVTTPIGTVPFEITSCRNYRWTWRVAKIPATGHRVEDVRADHCRVVFEIPLLAAGYAPVCQRALGQIESLLCD